MLVHNQASPLPGTCTEACTTKCVNGECHKSCTKECTRRKRDPHPLKTKREDVDSLPLKELKDDNDDDDELDYGGDQAESACLLLFWLCGR